MKNKIARYATRGTLFAAVLLATSLFAGTAGAQAGFQGKFNLPFEAHWGKAVLPAGDYVISCSVDTIGGMLTIRDAKSLRSVAFEPVNIRQDNAQGASSLEIGLRGNQRIVYSLKIAELGQEFVYDRPLAREAEEARRTQNVPVVVAEQ
jgi:hypothetical protein